MVERRWRWIAIQELLMLRIRFVPFTLFGVLSIAICLLTLTRGAVGSEGTLIDFLYTLLIMPLWLMRYVVVAVGGLLFGFGDQFPTWLEALAIPIYLLPYTMADLVLMRWRDLQVRRDRERTT